jgi:hypothetical protein
MLRVEVPVNYARQSRLGIRLAAGLWVLAILTALPGAATPVLDAIPTLENLVSQLGLSPEQEATLRPIFQARKSELVETQTLLQQATSRQQKQDIMRGAKSQADAFNAQVEGVLTPTQKSQWREIRAQTREKVKERAEDKRSSQ